MLVIMSGVKQEWAARTDRQPHDGDRRQEIVAAARIVFAKLGYSRTTVADIATEVGISRAAFYVYFASKADVFAALARAVRDDLIAAQDVAPAPDNNASDVLERSTVAYLDAYTRNLALLTVIEHSAISDRQIGETWREISERPVKRATRYIDRAVAHGIAEPAGSAAVIAEALIGIVAQFARMLEKAPHRRQDLERDIRRISTRLVGLPSSSTPSQRTTAVKRRKATAT